jgi:hypothetical protein
MIVECFFWCSAAVGIVAATWLLFSRSMVALILTVLSLIAVSFVAAYFTVWIWRNSGSPSEFLEVLKDSDTTATYQFFLPLTLTISLGLTAICFHWRRTRRVAP